MTNKGSQLRSRDLLILASLILIAALAAGITFAVVNRPAGDGGATPVAELAATQPAVASPGATGTAPPAVQPSTSPLPTPTLTATPCLPPAGWVLYRVQPNETLYSIAARYGLTAEELQQANCLPSGDLIQSGQGLYVPYLITPTSTPCAPPASWVPYAVQAGENLYRIALRYGMSARELQQANCLPSASAVRTGQTLYVPYLIPSPVPPPTRPPDGETTAVPNLKGEIFYDAGGEAPDPARCGPPTGATTHEITSSERKRRDTYQLCVYGFPMEAVVDVELYDPDNQFVATEAFTVTNPFDTSTKLPIRLWFPVGMRTGSWSAVAHAGGVSVTGSLEITPFLTSTISTVPQGDVNPFVRQACGTYSYQTDDEVSIKGAAFKAEVPLHLGIYRNTGEDPDPVKGQKLALVDDLIVMPDDHGKFVETVTATSTGQVETYWVIPVSDPAKGEYKRRSSIVCYDVE